MNKTCSEEHDPAVSSVSAVFQRVEPPRQGGHCASGIARARVDGGEFADGQVYMAASLGGGRSPSLNLVGLTSSCPSFGSPLGVTGGRSIQTQFSEGHHPRSHSVRDPCCDFFNSGNEEGPLRAPTDRGTPLVNHCGAGIFVNPSTGSVRRSVSSEGHADAAAPTPAASRYV